MVFPSSHAPTTVAPHSPLLSTLVQGLRYYIVRPGNIMVPLIPVDQLPFQLQRIPRHLNHQQMFEGGWKFLQETDETASPLPIQAPSQIQPAATKFLPPDHKARGQAADIPDAAVKSSKSQYLSTGPSPKVAESALEEHFTLRRGPNTTGNRFMDSTQAVNAIEDHSASLSDSFANIYQKDAQRFNYRALPPSGVKPDPTRKEFCSHWIKTGECAFTATGCRYKHEMPPVEKLRELGFTSVPRWWKDKSAIRGLTWMQRRLNRDKKEDPDQADEAPPRVFDPSTFRKHTRDSILGIRKTPNMKNDHGVFSRDNTRELVESLTSSRKLRIPNLIDMDTEMDMDTPGPPPSLESTSSTISDSSTAADPSSSPSSAYNSPPSPHPNLADLQIVTKKFPRYVRRHSETSGSSNDDRIRKQYPKRKSTPQKNTHPKPATLPTVSKRVGLGMSKYASKGKEVECPAVKRTQEKKPGKDAPALQSQITHIARQVGDKEGRRRNTDG